jgi:hypothetical protein
LAQDVVAHIVIIHGFQVSRSRLFIHSAFKRPVIISVYFIISWDKYLCQSRASSLSAWRDVLAKVGLGRRRMNWYYARPAID